MADSLAEMSHSEDETQEEMTPAELVTRLEEIWLNEKFSPELLENKSEIVECVMEQLNHMEENLQRVKGVDLRAGVHRMETERIRYVLSSYLRSRLQKIEKYFPHILEKEKSRAEGDPSCLSPEEFAFAKEYLANTETYLKSVALKHMPPNLQAVDLGKSGEDSFQPRVFSHSEFQLTKPLLPGAVQFDFVGGWAAIEKYFPHILEKEKSRAEGDPSCLSPEEFAFAKEYLANTETYLKSVALKHMPPNLQAVDLGKSVLKPNLDSFVFLRVKQRQDNILVEPETDEQREYTIDLEEGSQHLMRYRTIAPLVASGAVQLI
ncbi:SLD5 protein, partial [Polyodon spathula]|nr:SLD5 protein [Polyodon spathula]